MLVGVDGGRENLWVGLDRPERCNGFASALLHVVGPAGRGKLEKVPGPQGALEWKWVEGIAIEYFRLGSVWHCLER